MKKLILAISIFICSCSPELEKLKSIENKMNVLEEQTISQNTEINNIKAKLDEANKKLDDQRIKTDSLIAYNKQLILLITKNHNEDQNILGEIYEKITNFFK